MPWAYKESHHIHRMIEVHLKRSENAKSFATVDWVVPAEVKITLNPGCTPAAEFKITIRNPGLFDSPNFMRRFNLGKRAFEFQNDLPHQYIDGNHVGSYYTRNAGSAIAQLPQKITEKQHHLLAEAEKKGWWGANEKYIYPALPSELKAKPQMSNAITEKVMGFTKGCPDQGNQIILTEEIPEEVLWPKLISTAAVCKCR